MAAEHLWLSQCQNQLHTVQSTNNNKYYVKDPLHITFSVIRHVKYSLLSPTNITLLKEEILFLMQTSISIGETLIPFFKVIKSVHNYHIHHSYVHKLTFNTAFDVQKTILFKEKCFIALTTYV